MRRTPMALVTVALAAGIILGSTAPALAGDGGATLRSPVGDWRTRTDGVKQTITFDAKGRVYGDSGCNRFTGGYQVKGDRLTVGPLATTLMACAPDVMAAEQTFLARLQAATSYKATTRVLKVFAPKDMIRFVAN